MWACFTLARVRTPSSPVIERERKRERERERERESLRKMGERERERDVEYVQNCYFYFLKDSKISLP